MTKNLVLLEAERLWKHGFAIHWLRPKSKIPVESGWTTGPRKKWSELVKTYKPGFNVGVRLGAASKIEKGFLAVIDVDIRRNDFKTIEAAARCVRNLIGKARCPIVLSGRGNGSRHYYCITPEPFKMVTVRKEKDWEVCFYSEGRQVVLPPSVHPDTGQAYEWKRTGSIPMLSPPSTVSNEGKRPLQALEDFRAEKVDLGWLDVSSTMLMGMVEGTGVRDRSAFLLRATNALLSAGLTQNQILSVLTDPKLSIGQVGYEHAKTQSRARAAEWVHRYTFAKVKSEKVEAKIVFSDTPVPARKLTPEEMEEQEKEFTEERAWQQGLEKTQQGKIKNSLNNLDLILSHDLDQPAFIEDLFAGLIKTGEGSMPWDHHKNENLNDKYFLRIKSWIAKTYAFEPALGLVQEAVYLIADRNRRHPVQDWLRSLKWDGKKRVDTWLKRYCNAKESEPYLSEVSRKFLVAMVKRIFKPGCQWDYILILEGEQGEGKSTTARTIAGDEWFMDHLPDMREKDAMLNLQGKWIIELGELADVKRADYNLVKTYLIRRVDTVRAPYDRIRKDIPRQSVFIGTVNEGQYLKDPTGNRRYWPVRVGRCDPKALTGVREQLFAEAYAMYLRKEALYLSEEAETQARDAQEDRRVDDDATAMSETLSAFIERVDKEEVSFEFKRFRIRDLMTGIGPWGNWSGKGYLMNTAAHVLTKAGFIRLKIGGQRFWKRQ